jgi:hypothetical protein
VLEHESTAFISYSRMDSEFAKRLATDLKNAGVPVWFDQLDIKAGHEWDDSIETALTESDRLILILSPDSVQSRNVRNEITWALDKKKTLFPILIKDCEVPLQLRRIQYIDFRTDYARGFAALLGHLQGQPLQSGQAPDPLPQPPRTPLSRLIQFWPLAPLLAVLVALLISDIGSFAGYSKSVSCDLNNEAEQSGLSVSIYRQLASWGFHPKPFSSDPNHPYPNVSYVTIDANTEPPGLLNNVCDAREFLGRLTGDLNTLGARVIVIDRYFSPGVCADQEKTGHLIASLQASAAPVVVGQPTHALNDTSDGCLALSPKLDVPSSSAATKVFYGLTRLNSESLKIPLRWPVFKEPPTLGSSAIKSAMNLPAGPAAPPEQVSDVSQGNGLALVAAEAFDPSVASTPRLQKLLGAWAHPYTTFFKLPTVNAMTALCNAEPSHLYGPNPPTSATPSAPDLCAAWILPAGQLEQLKLMVAGKVVVIGDLTSQDTHHFPGGDVPGVFLQANYVQSILDRRFIEEAPLWIALAGLALFTAAVYCLYWAHDKKGNPLLTATQAGIGSLVLLALMVLIAVVALFGSSYFMPLWALWAAVVFLVFRYLQARRPVTFQPRASGPKARNIPA